MFKFVAFSALVAIAVAKPSFAPLSYSFTAPLETQYTENTFVAAPVENTFVAAPVESQFVAATVENHYVPAAPAVSHSYRSDVYTKPVVATTYAAAAPVVQKTYVAPVVEKYVAPVVEKYVAPVVEKTLVAAKYAAPVAEQYVAPVVEKYVAPVSYSAGYSHQSRFDVHPTTYAATYGAPLNYATPYGYTASFGYAAPVANGW